MLSLTIGTRWYKAPEVLLGSKKYDKGIDMWAVGWIFAEILRNKVMFQGNNDIEQIAMIIKAWGKPTKNSYPEFNELPDAGKLIFPESKGDKFSEVFNEYPETTGDFLNCFLQL